MSVLLTGGAGYIGSHTAVEFLDAGYEIIILDNFSNSSPDMIDRIARIGQKTIGKEIKLIEGDAADKETVRKIFDTEDVEGVIHFAGYKAVGESVERPAMYYRNNIDTALTVLEVMKDKECKNLVFSSSATVYGEGNPVPYNEEMRTGGCTNPYGWTKYMIEQILRDEAKAPESDMSVVLLRYFNPIGAHISGLIGENPNGIPNNLMPYITQTAVGIRERLSIFGNDYDTYDGTGVRDYIHVVDLAKGHVKAFEYALNHKGSEVFNLGTGRGTSVLEMVETFKRVNGVDVPYVFAERRAGDIASCYADTEKAERVLGWKAEKGVEDMCRDSWRWERSSGR